jgi:FtsH-binding integral membrane protein
MVDKPKDPAIDSIKKEGLAQVANSIFLFCIFTLLMITTGILPNMFKDEAFWIASLMVTGIGIITIAVWNSKLKHKKGLSIILFFTGFMGPVFWALTFHTSTTLIGSAFVYLEILFVAYIYFALTKYFRSIRKIKELSNVGVTRQA